MIALGCDHGGFDLKSKIIKYLQSQNIEFKDCGTFSKDSCDYPDIAYAVAKSIVSGEAQKGILICGTGIGISIAANKIKGIRAALCHDEFTARLSRKHNNANIICLGGRVLGDELAVGIVDVFLNTEFDGGRHQNRVDKIASLENI